MKTSSNSNIDSSVKSKLDKMIAFHHLYKCGGTTINWILQKNYPGHVLYCEKKEIEHVQLSSLADHLKMSTVDYAALSSHLINYEATAYCSFIFTFIREPASRILSAYNFDVSSGTYSDNLDSYIDARDNQMSRILGKDFIDSTNNGQNNIFCGILEQFDESLVCIENILLDRGVKIDLSYPGALNAGSRLHKKNPNLIQSLSNQQKERIYTLNSKDVLLYVSQENSLRNHMNKLPEFPNMLKEFKLRKENASSYIKAVKSYGQGPRHFVYV